MLRRPKEHAVSKKLRAMAKRAENSPGCGHIAVQCNAAASLLDQTIHSLGIWKEPRRIEQTFAYGQAKRLVERHERAFA